MKSCGALVGAETEFGEATLALNLGAVSWSVMHGLRSPTQHIRLIPDELPPKPSKLQVVFKLQMEGWTPTAETPASWMPGQPMLCRADLVKRPLSYYLVLLRHEAVIAKGVPEISHQQCDGYYTCLLNVPTQQLPALLDKSNDQSNAWFEGQLKEHNCALADGVGGDSSSALPLQCAAVAPLDGDVLQALLNESTMPALVEESVMNRVIVDAGPGTLAFKMYFDNFSGGGAHQRGFADCPCHGCIKYRPVHDESKETFCAWFLFVAAAWGRKSQHGSSCAFAVGAAKRGC